MARPLLRLAAAASVFALVAGCARWTELRGPRALAVRARWIWPVCLLLTGYMLVTYREA